MLVFTDGGNSPAAIGPGNHSLADVMRRAQQDDVMIYAHRPADDGAARQGRRRRRRADRRDDLVRPDPGLARIADETGGGYFELTRADDLAATFSGVADELHHQYALGFDPPRLDDKMHKIEVRVSQKGAKVRSRTEYFAAAASRRTLIRRVACKHPCRDLHTADTLASHVVAPGRLPLSIDRRDSADGVNDDASMADVRRM